MRKLLFFVLIVFMSGSVFALGVTPGRSNFDYIPGGMESSGFSVINDEKTDVNLVVIVEGELREFIEVSEDEFNLKKSEEGKELSYILQMPTGLQPGLHTSEISVVQVPEKFQGGDAFIGSVVGVKTQIHLFVPYPGKYVEGQINIHEKEDKIEFVIPVFNRGVEDINGVDVDVDIYSSLNNKIQNINSDKVSLLSGERKDIIVDWGISGVESGKYFVIAVVNYDGKILNLEREFNIGRKVLSLVGIGVKDFKLGDIAKFEMIVRSEWNEEIEGAYAEMLIYDDGRRIAELKSASKDVESKKKVLMELFWDTANVDEGIYDTSVLLNYGGNVEQNDFKLDVKEDEINIIGAGFVISKGEEGKGNLTMILTAVIIVLALANLSWFMYFRKKLKK